MKLFIVSDVHGFFDELMTALNEQGFDINNPEHVFVSLGDLTDRGTKPLECLQFVNSIPENRKILIRGNHEDLLCDLIHRKRFGNHDFHNGADKTIFGVIQEERGDILRDWEAITLFGENPDWQQYINSCINYWEDDKNVFVHGWIPTLIKAVDIMRPDLDEDAYYDDWRDGDWYQAVWTNGMKAWNDGARVPDKTVWCGHWHTSWGHAYLHNDGVEWLKRIETYYTDKDGKTHPYVRFDPFEDDGIVAMDACTVISGKVNCKTIEVEKI